MSNESENPMRPGSDATTKEETNYNGMTKDEYHYIFGLTTNHPNQEFIMHFIRELLKKTRLDQYWSGWKAATKQAQDMIKMLADGQRPKRGLDHSPDYHLRDQLEKIPTTQDKMNRIFAVMGLKKTDSGMSGPILRGSQSYTPEMVEEGKEIHRRASQRGASGWRHGRGWWNWGNFASSCEFPRCVTGKLLAPGDIVIRRNNTAEDYANGTSLAIEAPFAISSYDELRETDELLYVIGEDWEKIRPSNEEE